MRRLRAWASRAWPVLLVTTLILAALEVGLRIALATVTRESTWLATYRHYYRYEEMQTVQYLEACAQWDARLGYRLRPGRCVFENREFRVAMEIDRLGVRDDERSLDAPELVFLGDSYTMGWGVEGDEAFPSLVEARTGRRVLDAGISSYGTARELRLLEEIDTSRLEWLVIQYSGNDSLENRAFVEDPATPTMDEALYRTIVRERRPRDYPGKLVLELLPTMVRDAMARATGHPERTAFAQMLASERPSPHEQARDFLQLLARAEHVPRHARIVVFELGGFALGTDAFVEALREQLRDPALAGLRERITLVSLAAALGPEHYFVLDSHLDAQGHRIVADRVCEVIGC